MYYYYYKHSVLSGNFFFIIKFMQNLVVTYITTTFGQDCITIRLLGY